MHSHDQPGRHRALSPRSHRHPGDRHGGGQVIAIASSRGGRCATLALGLAMLAACSSNPPKNVDVSGPATGGPPPVTAGKPAAGASGGPAPRAGPMKAAEIMQTLANK